MPKSALRRQGEEEAGDNSQVTSPTSPRMEPPPPYAPMENSVQSMSDNNRGTNNPQPRNRDGDGCLTGGGARGCLTYKTIGPEHKVDGCLNYNSEDGCLNYESKDGCLNYKSDGGCLNYKSSGGCLNYNSNWSGVVWWMRR